MKIRQIMFMVLIASLLFSTGTWAGGRRAGDMPAPRLMAPDDLVDLKGQETLEFQWGTESGSGIDHYDFRLYRGTQTYEKNLILQQNVPQNHWSVKINASQFQPGESYCWSLRSVGARKSRSAYSIFKIKS